MENNLANAQWSPFDIRDYQADYIFSKEVFIPNEYDPRKTKEVQPIRDQTQQGSCVAFSVAAIKEWQEKKNTGFDDFMSPQFIYNLRFNQDGQGMYLRDAMNILKNYGILPEERFPYTERIGNSGTISQDQFEEAKNYRIQGYAQITGIDTLKTAIYKNGPCVAAFPYYGGTYFWRRPNEITQPVSAHAVSIVGYNKEGFIIKNSWGPEFGDKGYIVYPYSDWGLHGEIWTTFDDTSSKPDPRYNKWYWKFFRWSKKQFNIKKHGFRAYIIVLAGTIFIGFLIKYILE